MSDSYEKEQQAILENERLEHLEYIKRKKLEEEAVKAENERK